MSIRFFGACCVVTVVLSMVVPASGQGPTAADDTWIAPRTADGQPDLQAVWANNNATPLQRPEALANRETLTLEELVRLKARAGDLFSDDSGDAAFGDSVFSAALAEENDFTSTDSGTGNYNHFWLVERDWDNRTSLIVEPSGGRLPPTTPEGQARLDARSEARQRHARWTDDRSLSERCITYGVPRIRAGYNSYFQLIQSSDYVVILAEMIHDARIVPLDGRPPLDGGIRQWHGDSRGHWDGETLVVETTNYSPKSYFMGATENLHMTERLTRVAPDVLEWEVTIKDPTTWTAPWTVMIPLRRSDDALYEYACHEGNIGMEGILSGARAMEKAESEGSR